MRASGSQSVSFEDVQLPGAALRGGFPTGDATGYLEKNVSAGLFHSAAAVGIAETADAAVVSRLAGRPDLATQRTGSSIGPCP
jgi:alkylation response protein AidB-like acyl-CoA dehydrogenase